jgi:uncharacterized membrane protein YedE/YeeE
MIGMILSALAVGIATGWILQRGRTCMNSAFRDIIFINDYTLFKAYILALLVLIIGANLLEEFMLVEELRRQAFFPIANIVGGYIFGLGIVLAGGCGSGIWYRVGEGMFSAWVSVLGFILGINLTRTGLLKPVNEFLKRLQIWFTEDGIQVFSPEQFMDYPGDIEPLTLYNLLGVNKWILIIVITVIILPLLLRGTTEKPKVGYPWYQTGIMLGLVAIAAWWASEVWGGGARGISYAGPTFELFRFIESGGEPTWSSFLVIGTPIGALLSAIGLKEFKLKAPGAEELLRVFIGGVVMGIGAVIGGGCNIGHGLTGVSTLAISSIVATIFIVLGNWTMVYFLFIKPLKD